MSGTCDSGLLRRWKRRSRPTSPTASSSGASLSISVDGRNVVDLWGGHLDARDDGAVGARQPGLRLLVHQGRRGHRHDVGGGPRVWSTSTRPSPPTGRSSPPRARTQLPVRWLLTHEAGLPAVAERMPFGSLSDWEAMTTALAAQAPVVGARHRPRLPRRHLRSPDRRGAAPGHRTHRRRDHRATELAAPLGVDLAMPLPAALDARTADLVVDLSPDGTFFDRWTATSIGPRAFGNPPDCNDPNHCTTDDVPSGGDPCRQPAFQRPRARPSLLGAGGGGQRGRALRRAGRAGRGVRPRATCGATTS